VKIWQILAHKEPGRSTNGSLLIKYHIFGIDAICFSSLNQPNVK